MASWFSRMRALASREGLTFRRGTKHSYLMEGDRRVISTSTTPKNPDLAIKAVERDLCRYWKGTSKDASERK